ncbi:carbohydrate ABC transporter permease [Paenibacillus puerhi]|uniref:carbohydrate ABC transporter permease n=1 Tax=Paenibacillus puerhi TaxID=2692622 RepID=UPI00135BA09F|nr:carbohydrate ABC transporter permease [Paenibacillus puerhi]
MKQGLGSRIFDTINHSLLLLFAICTLLPFIHVFAGSFTSVEEYVQKPFILIPTDWSLDAYRVIFSTPVLFRSLLNSVFVTVAGTLLSMLLSILMAYGLSKKELPGRRTIMFMVVFTLMFSGGLIPTFLVVRSLGMLDSYWAMLIPSAINAFNLIILKNFFQHIPDGIEESAKMDGASDFGILFRIVIPLSMPSIATIALFYGVSYWNMFYQALIYINDSNKWPIQVLLRQIILISSGLQGGNDIDADLVRPPEQTIKMAVIVVATIPILFIYPFIQKYFAKGVLLGSVKG